MNENRLKPNQKIVMSIEDAAAYSGLGVNMIRKIIQTDNTIDWLLHIGNRLKIKRISFENWILNLNRI